MNQILDRNVAWIENCDNKASVILGTLGVALGLLFSQDFVYDIIKEIVKKSNNGTFWAILILIAMAASFCAMLWGVWCLIKTLTPKLDYRELEQDAIISKKSVIFFSNIASHSNFTSFYEELGEINEEDYLKDLSSQIYICAKICDQKFKNYKEGLYYSALGFVFFILIPLLNYFL